MNENDINPAGLIIEESDYPKATILPGEDYFSVRIFLGENELPFEVWSADVKYLGPGELKLILEVPISAVEFKKN